MMLFPNTIIGQSLFLFGKIWVLFISTVWPLYIDNFKLKFSFSKIRPLMIGAISGIMISLIIFAAYFLLGDILIDPSDIKEMAINVGLGKKTNYIFMAIYWVIINSILEEYVWRFFIVKKASEFLSPLNAVIISSVGFTFHHILATSIYFNAPVVILISLGVFTGGIIWSYMFLKYKSIWPGYLSHAIVDVAVFVIGYLLIFSP